MTFKQKLVAWLLVLGYYVFTFTTPMVAAYYLLSSPSTPEEGRSGLWFYMIVTIFGGGLIIALMKLINKQKANVFKTIFRLCIKLALVLGVIQLALYIDFNIDKLVEVLYIALGGFAVGSLFEVFAVNVYRDYMRELGVF